MDGQHKVDGFSFAGCAMKTTEKAFRPNQPNFRDEMAHDDDYDDL